MSENRNQSRPYLAWVFVVLAAVVVAAGVYLGRLKRTGGAPKANSSETTNAAATLREARPKSPDDLKVGKVEIDQPKGSGLRYAVGTLKNDSDHPRYGITVELTLSDRSSQTLPTKASDYVQMLEPRKEWRFRALVLDSKAVSAKVASIREEE